MGSAGRKKRKEQAIKEFVEAGCPYCGSKIELVDGAVISSTKRGLMFYRCTNYPECDAYVSVHKGTNIPVGKLADKTLRTYRQEAHAVFDRMWQGRMDRKDAYAWLSMKLGFNDSQDCHIGQFLEGNCLLTIKICQEYLEGMKEAVPDEE